MTDNLFLSLQLEPRTLKILHQCIDHCLLVSFLAHGDKLDDPLFQLLLCEDLSTFAAMYEIETEDLLPDLLENDVFYNSECLALVGRNVFKLPDLPYGL